MPKPLVGSLGAVALLAATLLHAPAHTPAGVAEAEASTSTPTQTLLAAQAATLGTRLRLTAPRRIAAGTRLAVRGTAPTSGRGRVVVLSVKRAGAWKQADKARTNRNGAFTLKAKAGTQTGRSQWRVAAPRSGRLRPLTTRFAVTITARKPGGQNPTEPTPAAVGSPSDWTYISAGKSMRWDSCTPITWHYAPTRQPYGSAQADVMRAVEMLAARTGHTFTRVSEKSAASLTIEWATPQQEPMLRGSTVGVGGPSYQSIDPARNHGTQALIVSGSVTLDATEGVRPGFNDANGWTWGQVMLHEIMHALGLGHARGEKQVMYPMASTQNQSFGAGDLTGLRMVGSEKGCIDTGMTRQSAARIHTALVAE